VNRAIVLATIVIVAALGRSAAAYPQFQLSREQTCTSCHLSPAGGGLLDENGTNFLENASTYGRDGRFMYDAFQPPAWLELGGAIRTAYGYMHSPQNYLVGFPMQADIYASAKLPAHLRLTATVGGRPTEYGNEAATRVWSREHFLTWSQDDDGSEGLFVRVGRFMPVFGLRYVEHPTYTRRFGGTPLYGETYGVAVEYINRSYEAHLTGFVKDPVQDTVVHDNGAAFYGEYRVVPQASVGIEGMYTKSVDDSKLRGGVTAKYYAKSPDLLFELEAQVVNQKIASYGLTQLVGELTATKFFTPAWFLDLGIGHYDENLRIAGLDRNSIDLNLHWLTLSHLEVLLATRLELINQGRTQGTALGGPTSGYALVQFNYRL
jgi:hypothetical protein